MKFFNIDLHISVIADIKNIFENLGHQVDTVSLSSHSWIMNKSNDNSWIINQNNWKDINQEMCDLFYEKYKNILSDYDGFISAYPPAFSQLYERFNKPIICVAATRYEFPYTTKKNEWLKLNNYLSNNKNIIRIANNKFDKYYSELFTDKEWHHIPSLCEYTEAKYNKKINKSVFFSKKVTINNLINKESLGKHSWQDLYSYKSIVHIPYNYSTMSILEQYTANVPLLFPTKNFLIELFIKNLAMSEISFLQVIAKQPESTLEVFEDPNNYKNFQIFINNLHMCDFYDEEWMPYLTYFNSLEEIEYITNNLNCELISNKIKEKNVERKEKIYFLWKNILNDLQ